MGVPPPCRWCLLRASPRLLRLVRGNETLFDLGPVSSFAASFATKDVDDKNKKKKKKDKEKGKKKEKRKGKDANEGMNEHDRHRFDELVGKALDAPSPYRHVKEKERLREAELEKYGLMTKAKQIELEQEKAREKAKKKAGDDGTEEKLPLTWEEGQRLAKAYSRLLMRAHRQQQAGESLRLRLKKAAIENLPPGLKEAALVPDFSPFPPISPATLTPPIPGFVYEYVPPKDKLREDSQSKG